MKRLSLSELSLRLVRPLSQDALAESEILIAGSPTGKTVTGAVLEAAFASNELFLIFVTDDIPQEETLRIYLLDRASNVIDSASIGAMYSTGYFSGLGAVSPDTVSFDFIGDTRWTLQLLGSDQMALPFLSDPKGVSRPFSLRRRFQLRGHPLPDRSR